MKIYRQMIRDRDYNNLSDFSKEKFDKVGESVDRMSKTLKDLLTYTSLSLEEQAEPVDLNDVLRMVESDLELLIEQKGARLHKTPLPSVKGVPLQMHRLFYNLVNNALKFSRSDAAPVIEIHAGKLPRERHGGFPLLTAGQAYYEIVVSDNGIGFEQDKAERIFGMFQRLHSREEYSGTGIGLALCRKVVNNHGGHIYANATPGKGTRFHILLPENE
jgi:signal transduction histidine kinase